jgi:hypothetical protein
MLPREHVLRVMTCIGEGKSRASWQSILEYYSSGLPLSTADNIGDSSELGLVGHCTVEWMERRITSQRIIYPIEF